MNEAAYHAAIDLHKQIAFVAALLSGFSITFLIGLIQLDDANRQVLIRRCILLIAFSTCALLISTLTSLTGAYWLTERPNFVSMDPAKLLKLSENRYALTWSSFSLLFGFISLLLSIGLCGFLKSKRLGRITTLFAVFTIIMIFYFWIFLVNPN